LAVLPIRLFGDPVLKETCPEVPGIDRSVESLVKDLVDSLPRPGGAGLSANQIGVLKRVFVFENEGEIEAVINPRILSRSGEKEEDVEGCLSLPGIGVPVARHLSVEVEYYDIHGKRRVMKAEGWLARVFQHEIDHLDGKLILDRTDRISRVEALELLQGGTAPGTERGGGEPIL
jgi:peptide deformylase